MFVTIEPFILASASPRRREYLENLGLQFEVMAADVDETVPAGESPFDFVLRLATEKARFVARMNPDRWVLGADTVVVKDNEILGKPKSEAEAANMLKSLAGRSHQVWTGFCLSCKSQRRERARAVKTDVTFTDLTKEIIVAYVRTGEPMDKAGAYGIQGLGGTLVRAINGSYSNVVGLPLAEVVSEMINYKIITSS